MKEIKFRGKTRDGRIVFGDFIRLGEEVCIGNIFCNDKVLPGSVAQLIGYDKDGNEIYSDDKVINVHGAVIPFSAVMISFSELGGSFKNLKLKR